MQHPEGRVNFRRRHGQRLQFEVLDQTGQSDINALAGATYGVMGAANQGGNVMGAFSQFRADDPQLIVDIDRDKARSLGLPLREVTDALQVFLGSQYVNDFDFNNRSYRVYVQADKQYRSQPRDLRQFYVRSDTGQMLPLDTFARVSIVKQGRRVVAFEAQAYQDDPALPIASCYGHFKLRAEAG